MVSWTAFAESPDIIRFLSFGSISALYAFSWVGLYLLISAATRRHVLAMFGVLAAYFIFVPFWWGFVGPLSLATIVNATLDLFGLTLTEPMKHYIVSLSPSRAYVLAERVVCAGSVDQYDTIQMNYEAAANTDAIWTQLWYNITVLLGWAIISPAIGYDTFRNAEL